MRFLLAFTGTRGDIQPAVVVATELLRRGHDVVCGVPPNLVDFAAAAGVDARPFGHDTRAHMNSDLVREGLRRGGPRERWRALSEIRNAGWNRAVADMSALAREAQVIVTGWVSEQIATAHADALAVPCVSLHHAPVRPNRSVLPVPGVPPALPAPAVAAGWWLTETAMWALTRSRQNALRRALAAPGPATRAPRTAVEVQVYDPILCPDLCEEWAPRVARPFTGFLAPDPADRARLGDGGIDAGLRDWLEAGDPPVYVGFGSMPVPDAASTVAAVAAACDRLGVRALVGGGWHALDVSAHPRLRAIGPADHAQVFPRCRAVVHHGGAGTTAAALRAGVPSVICWLGSDQPFWGRRCVDLGVGATLPLKGLTADALTEALRVALEPGTAARAAALSGRLVPPGAAVAACADAVEDSPSRVGVRR